MRTEQVWLDEDGIVRACASVETAAALVVSSPVGRAVGNFFLGPQQADLDRRRLRSARRYLTDGVVKS
jgi:hypothetical protein